MARIDYASGIASILVDRPISVYSGSEKIGPHYHVKLDQIRLGYAYHLPWDDIDIHGVIVHECSHVLFPAPYPSAYHGIANLIDDCRIERQMSARKPHLESSLQSLVLNVIANRKYDPVDENGNLVKDPWAPEHFGPGLWALLYFRHHTSAEVRNAASDCVKAWVKDKGLNTDPEWKEKFRKLVRSGLAITRLAKVSEKTLEQWCELFLEVFPSSKANDGDGDPLSGDTDGSGGEEGQEQENGDKGENAPGSGDAPGDENKVEKTVEKVSGNAPGEDDDEEHDDTPSKGDDEEHDADQSREAESNDELRDALEKLRNKITEEGKKASDKAKQENPDHKGLGGEENNEDDEDDDNSDRLPGVNAGVIETVQTRNKDAIDDSFVGNFVRSVRKMTQISMAKDQSYRRTGRLDMGKVVRSKAVGFDSLTPFRKETELPEKVPVSCVVATDNSGSTKNIIESLNRFTHNTLCALRKAKCESAGVVWNTSAKTVVGLRDSISPVSWNSFGSCGGTSLIPCAHECVKASKGARGRKVAFIFTDGSVWEHEVPEVSDILTKAGFSAALIISLESSVPRSGIVDTVVARTLGSVTEKFDKWVKNQYMKDIKGKR